MFINIYIYIVYMYLLQVIYIIKCYIISFDAIFRAAFHEASGTGEPFKAWRRCMANGGVPCRWSGSAEAIG